MVRFYITFLLFFSVHALAAERIVDEKTITTWGYKTISLDDSQFIKNIVKINESGAAIYPRFYISKECSEKPEEAQDKIQKIEHLQKT